ncbi:Hypothetical predicted protein [Octopus vulgaris]|uniref:Uncharacterized protein n=1 Tax=Octopus vulgaris TaxID=6645 RepID=A0AA36AXX9_OCTVU|nr:Hypothetical predicted protein [Octopus vulgaris]
MIKQRRPKVIVPASNTTSNTKYYCGKPALSSTPEANNAETSLSLETSAKLSARPGLLLLSTDSSSSLSPVIITISNLTKCQMHN